MSVSLKRLLFWTPRILCILFAVFISLFALDVFGSGLGFRQTILALLIHLVPTYIVIVVTVISWRWELFGAFLFTGLGFAYIFMAWGRFHWSAYAVISGPLFLIGVLFLLNWVYRAELHAGPSRTVPHEG